jgi:hypothetical protein
MGLWQYVVGGLLTILVLAFLVCASKSEAFAAMDLGSTAKSLRWLVAAITFAIIVLALFLSYVTNSQV